MFCDQKGDPTGFLWLSNVPWPTGNPNDLLWLKKRYIVMWPQLTFLMFRLSRSPGIRERQSAVFISKKQGQLVHFYAVFLAIACKFPETRSNRTDLAQTLFVNWSSSSFCCWTWFRSDAIGKFWKSSLELFGFLIHLKNQFPLPRTFLS